MGLNLYYSDLTPIFEPTKKKDMKNLFLFVFMFIFVPSKGIDPPGWKKTNRDSILNTYFEMSPFIVIKTKKYPLKSEQNGKDHQKNQATKQN